MLEPHDQVTLCTGRWQLTLRNCADEFQYKDVSGEWRPLTEMVSTIDGLNLCCSRPLFQLLHPLLDSPSRQTPVTTPEPSQDTPVTSGIPSTHEMSESDPVRGQPLKTGKDLCCHVTGSYSNTYSLIGPPPAQNTTSLPEQSSSWQATIGGSSVRTVEVPNARLAPIISRSTQRRKQRRYPRAAFDVMSTAKDSAADDSSDTVSTASEDGERRMVTRGDETLQPLGGTYRYRILFDPDSEKWSRHKARGLRAWGYSDDERARVVIAADYTAAEQQDSGLRHPMHGFQLRWTFPEWIAAKSGRDAQVKGWGEWVYEPPRTRESFE